jgi:nucleoside-diphosphate-sugar epimerase
VRIVIAGGRGFIGRGLTARLRGDHTLAVWDFPEVNLLDSASFADALERFKPDLVVNLAAVLGGVQSKNVRQIFETNFGGNLNLVEQCVAHGVRRYVFASSLTVHGSNPLAEPCTLASPFNPKHAYGASKAAAEFSLIQYAKHFGMAVVALRPTLVLGDTAVSHAPIDFIRTLLAGGRIELYGSGTHEREWLWIDDAVAGFIGAVDFCAQAEGGYYPFFLGGQRIAMRDLAFRCAAHLGKGPESVQFVDSREQAFSLTCDLTESERILGWKPHCDLDGMIGNLIQILKKKSACP